MVFPFMGDVMLRRLEYRTSNVALMTVSDGQHEKAGYLKLHIAHRWEVVAMRVGISTGNGKISVVSDT